MNEHERMLNILGAVPGIRAVAEKVTEPSEKKNFDYKIHATCNEGGQKIITIYTNEKKIDMYVNANVCKIVEAIIMKAYWIGKDYLSLAIDLLTVYRDEVNK